MQLFNIKRNCRVAAILFFPVIAAISTTAKAASHKPPQSLAEAAQDMVGTWTYTGSVDANMHQYPWEWIRWIIRADGSATQCYARPVDDGWDHCSERKPELVTQKYADTGTRWYGMRTDAVLGIYDPEADTINIRILGNIGVAALTRGDKNPFSK